MSLSKKMASWIYNEKLTGSGVIMSFSQKIIWQAYD